MRIDGLSRALLGVTAASLALLSLAYGVSALTARAIPTTLPGREAWVIGAALLVLMASVGLSLARTALPSAVTIAVYLLAWTVSYTPQVLAKPLSFEGWYGFCEALTMLVGACCVGVMLWSQTPGSPRPLTAGRALRTARMLFGLICIFYGASHLAFADFTASMVPAWLPARLAFAYATGIAHIAAGIALVFGVWPLAAATLEACMMALFGLLVWAPSFLVQPRPVWASSPQNQWSELVVSAALAASAGIVAASIASRLSTIALRERT